MSEHLPANASNAVSHPSFSLGAVRVIDRSGRILYETSVQPPFEPLASGHLGSGPLASDDVANDQSPSRTERAIWDQQQPRDALSDAPLSYLDSPAVRALSGETVVRQTLRVRNERAEWQQLDVDAGPLTDGDGRVIGACIREHAFAPNTPASPSIEQTLPIVAQMTTGLLHDVNNSLNPIMHSVFLLQHNADSPVAVREYAAHIQTAVDRATATATRLGHFVRQAPLLASERSVIPLDVLLTETLHAHARLAAQRVAADATIHVDTTLVPRQCTTGVAPLLAVAIDCLIDNALDAMPAGGTLRVWTLRDGDRVCLAVSDTGSGMTDAAKRRAFEPFFSTKQSGEQGLGLSQVFGIARRHQATVRIEQTSETGTIVSLRLPLADAVDDLSPVTGTASTALIAPVISDSDVTLPVVIRAGELAAVAPRTTPTSCHILVVEDHDDGRELLRRMLVKQGHTVDVAANCAEARQRLAIVGQKQYDLLVTDVGLPDGSGWGLVVDARRHVPDIRVGVITGWEPIVSDGDAASADFVLQKPLRFAELLVHISGVNRNAPIE